MAPPPAMSQTWFPSQTGPIVLMATRRSVSVLATKGKQRADAEVEAVGGGKGDQQHAEKQPPDQAQGFVVYQFVQDHDGYSAAGTRVSEMSSASGSSSGSGPFLMARIIRVISITMQHGVEGGKADDGQQYRAGAAGSTPPLQSAAPLR